MDAWGVGLGSGHGSRPWATLPYRKYLSDFIRCNDVRSVVDYGCGDWEIGRRVDWQGATYTGVDVVPHLIERNQREFARPGVTFMVTPDEPTALPRADLLLCKDVLQHLPNSDVQEFLVNVVPRFRMALIIDDAPGTPDDTNTDTSAGGWRRVDIRQPPFDVDATVVRMLRMPPAITRKLQKLNGGTKSVMLVRP